MKKLFGIIVIALFTVPVHAQFSKATLQATGLTCAMCSNAINKALQEIPFIESVRSDIKNSAFNIVFKVGEEVNIDALKNAVEEAGFFVGNLKLTGLFSEVIAEKDKHVQIGKDYFHFLNGSGQVLNGENTIMIADKNFVTAKEFKKISGMSKMKCLQTGVAAECCSKDGVPVSARVYHISI